MPGSPTECRERAWRYAELARTAATAEARKHFASLQQSWARLAAEIETGERLIELIDKIGDDLAGAAPPEETISPSPPHAA
jgi:hypothetical protein